MFLHPHPIRRRWLPATFVGGVIAAAITGCLSPSGPPSHRHQAACCRTNSITAPPTFSDDSLYQIDSSWTTDGGDRRRFSSFAGRVQVVVMFFASCQYACPVLVHDLKKIAAALPADTHGKVGFTLITFDTVRDTPEALRTFRRNQQIPAGDWTFLQGSPDDTQELAALLGVRYSRDGNGQFAHSNLITVLEPGGKIIHQQVGLNQDIAETVQAITSAVLSPDNSRTGAHF